MRDLPPELLTGPFTRDRALELGMTSRMLQGRRFVSIHRGVWRHREYELTDEDLVAAAGLALPDHAHLTGITRLQALDLDFGPRTPVRFVVEGDLHLALDGVFLHRTARLPPIDEVGVIPAAAFIAYCAKARVIDAIKVGDWLLRGAHMTVEQVEALALSGLWRDGAHEAIWILPHLSARSRSLKESETRSVLRFAGLVEPEVNAAVDVQEDVEVIGDLVYRRWKTIVEYEGIQHQADRAQYISDLDRYGLLRGAGFRYVQVTHEKLSRAQTLVGEVYRALLAGGYDGPAPRFGEHWRQLFLPISVAVGPRRLRASGSAVG